MLALLVLGVLVAFTPPAQAWLAEREIEKLTGWHATVGTVVAGFSSFSATNVRLEHGEAVLKIPIVEASLPLKSALWDRNIRIEKLVATGWTLELGGPPGVARGESSASMAPQKSSGGSAARAELLAVRGFAHLAREFIRGRSLPCELSLDGVELEGEIVMKDSAERRPAGLHVSLKGGGLAAGRTGEFVFDATGALKTPGVVRAAIAPRGRLTAAMRSSRVVEQLAFDGSLSSADRLLPEDFTISAAVAAAGSTGNETYTLKLSREGRPVVSVDARFPPETRQLSGTWKIIFLESDLARFQSDRALPVATASGEGRFECDPAFSQAQLAGDARLVVSRLAAVLPQWDRVGSFAVNVEFDFVHRGQSLRFDRLNATVGGTQPIALVRVQQPFELHETTGGIKPAAPDAAWLAVSLQKFPLAWLPAMASGFMLAEGDASGDITVKTAGGGFALNSNGPLVARAVVVQRAGGKQGPPLDLSLAMTADFSPPGWRMQAAPLIVESAGQRLASIEAICRPGAAAGQPAEITGQWKADPSATAASGEFSARLGTSLDLSTKLTALVGAPAQSVTANLQAKFDRYGGVAWHGPVTIGAGTGASEFSLDASSSRSKAGPRVDLAINSVDASLEHLGLLAAWLAAAGGTPVSSHGRDQRPFWGESVGQARVGIYRLRTGDLDWNEVAGTFDLDHGAIRLTGGRGKHVPPAQPAAKRNDARAPKEEPTCNASLEGSVTFEATVETPYRLNATASVDVIDAARLLGPPQSGRDPLLEGRFSAACTFAGTGINLDDLLQRRREEIRLKSNVGILRLLKTEVAASLSEEPKPMAEALGKVGDAVGFLLGLRPNAINSAQKSLNKETDAVLNFASQMAEIGYEEFAVTAARGADRHLTLTEIALSAPRVRLTGRGQINFVPGQPLQARPFGMELQIAVSGKTAELASTARLLSDAKDQQGFRTLNQSIHFGGTLEKIEGSQWHDLLVKAALPAPPTGKKGG